MLPRDYVQAWFPADCVILEQRLKPLSLGHLLLLERVENRYVGKEEPKLDDLLTGVIICSNNFADGCALIENPNVIAKAVYQWGKRLYRKRWPWSKPQQPDLAKASEDFEKYLAAGLNEPKLVYEDGKSRETGSPWPESVLALLRKMDIAEAVALDMPLTRVYHICYTHLETVSTAVRYMTPSEIQMHEEAKAEREKEAVNG